MYESLHLGSKGINREQLLIAIPYRLDAEKFKQAWQLCFIKHPAILAKHDAKTNTTKFEISEDCGAFFETLDLENANSQDLQSILELDRHQKACFDSTAVKVKLIRLSDEHFQCIWCFHHAQVDGASIAIVIKDVFDFYERLIQGEPTPTPTPDLDYLDYLEQLSATSNEASELYWQRHLEGYAGALRPEIYDNTSSNESSKKVAARSSMPREPLIKLASDSDCRINNIFQVAWAVLIARYCDTEDIVFGTVRACRNISDRNYWGTVGMFMNIVPQRIDVDAERSVTQLLKAAREQQCAHKPFENTPLPLIAKAARIPTTDLLGSLMMYSEQPINQFFTENANWRSCSTELFEQSSFPVELIIYAGEIVEIKIEGIGLTYSQRAIDSMLASLLFIIQQMIEAPLQKINNVDLLPPSTANSIIFQHAPPSSSIPPPFLKIIESAFNQSGHRLAITDNDERYSYERIDTLSRNVAHALINNGLNKGGVVAISMGRSAKSVIAQVGVLRAGGVFINVSDNDPIDRNEFILTDSQAGFLIFDSDEPSVETTDKCIPLKFANTIVTQPNKNHLDIQLNTTDTAYIIYTSGTTGTPKGVAINHGNLSNHIASVKIPFGITKDDHILQFASHTFDVAIEEIFLSLACAAHIVVRDEFCISSANSFIDFLIEHNITVLNIPTAFWHFLVERMGNKMWPNSLRLLIVGGEEPTLATLKKWRRQNTQHIRWINAYGPTETTITSTVFEDAPEKPLKAGNAIPIGKPLQNVTHYILDSRKKPLPLGCPGQLYIGGLGVACGYLNRPELSQEKFLADPYASGLKMYSSGDKAYQKADGNFVYLGRSDTQVKVRGFRVELGELENTCLLHPAVTGCIAEKPKEEDSLTIYIISTHENIAEEIIAFLRKKLPPYAIPSRVKVVESIPLTNSGKLSRKNLDELKLIGEAKVKTDEQTSPRDDTEQKLLSIWNDHLPEAVSSINQSFFDAGGHSLLAVQVFSDIEDEFDTTIDIRRFFGEPTIAWLGSEIRATEKANKSVKIAAKKNSEAESRASVIPLQAEGSGIPIYCICGIEIYRALASSLGAEQPVFGVFLPVEGEMIKRFSQGRNFQLPSVAEMAQSYVDAIIENTPEGPVGLAGVSFGGLLAFEIAQQLKSKGREIAHLTLMESFLSRAMKRKGYLEWTLEHAIYYLKKPHLIKNTLRKSLASLRNSKSLLDINSMDDIASADFGELRWRAYHYAANKYDTEISAYDGNVTLFKAEQQPPRLGVHLDSTYGWANLIKGELEIFTVPGDHLGVLTPPNVGVLARKLLPRVRSANQLNIRL